MNYNVSVSVHVTIKSEAGFFSVILEGHHGGNYMLICLLCLNFVLFFQMVTLAVTIGEFKLSFDSYS